MPSFSDGDVPLLCFDIGTEGHGAGRGHLLHQARGGDGLAAADAAGVVLVVPTAECCNVLHDILLF